MFSSTHGRVCINQHARTYIGSELTLDAVYKTYKEWQMIRTDGGRESGNSVLSPRLDEAGMMTTLEKIKEWALIEDMHLSFFVLFFNLAANKLITDVTQNLLNLIAEHSDFIKYSLNKLNKIEWNKTECFFLFFFFHGSLRIFKLAVYHCQIEKN